MPAPLAVELLPAEAELLSGIAFSVDRLNYLDVRKNGERVLALMQSLWDRQAIPAIRVRYFTEAEHNIGSRHSIRETFEGNGTRGEDIFRHPHFLKYLRYFLRGPDLPAQVITALTEAVEECGNPITSGDCKPLVDAAKKLTRAHSLDPRDAAEEFYKLALEVGAEVHARAIRDAVRKLPRR